MASTSPDPIDGPIGRGLWERADRVMVGGGIYLTRSADMAGRGVLPGFVAEADGCRITDADGRTYIDLMGANGPNILGYRHPEVEAAADAVRRVQTTASLFPVTLVEVVERVVAAPPVDGLGGGGQERVGGGEPRGPGGPPAHPAGGPWSRSSGPITATIRSWRRLRPTGRSPRSPPTCTACRWNGAEALLQHAADRGDEIAAIVLNPIDQSPRRPTVSASADFVAAVEEVRRRHGVPLVFDDVRHGMRLASGRLVPGAGHRTRPVGVGQGARQRAQHLSPARHR